jgi:hypothetical protein
MLTCALDFSFDENGARMKPSLNNLGLNALNFVFPSSPRLLIAWKNKEIKKNMGFYGTKGE